MKTIGIDLGTSQTGFCEMGEGWTNISLYCPPKDEKDRVRYIADKLKYVVVQPDIIVIEKPFNVMGNGRILLELLGAVKYALDPTFRVVEIPQTSLKKFATDMGNAQKSDMVLRAFKEFGVQASSEDEIDAFWMALFGQYVLDMPDDAPAFRREAVEKMMAPKVKKTKKAKKEAV